MNVFFREICQRLRLRFEKFAPLSAENMTFFIVRKKFLKKLTTSQAHMVHFLLSTCLRILLYFFLKLSPQELELKLFLVVHIESKNSAVGELLFFHFGMQLCFVFLIHECDLESKAWDLYVCVKKLLLTHYFSHLCKEIEG